MRCQALVADAGTGADAALTADAANRARYLDCQTRQSGLIDVVKGWIDAGIIGSKP